MATLLYVEDHPPAQLLMSALIKDMTTHHLLLASDGKSALEMTDQHKPDLYIIDLDLPDGNGITLAAQLIASHPAPVILVSAYGEAVDDQHPAISYYLAKPLDPNHVAETIKRALT